MESITPLEENPEIVQLSAARSRVAEEASATIARQLNGPLTALLLYMNEIKQHSHQFSQAPGNRLYLQQVLENALQQTERVCALVKQISDNHPAPASERVHRNGTYNRKLSTRRCLAAGQQTRRDFRIEGNCRSDPWASQRSPAYLGKAGPFGRYGFNTPALGLGTWGAGRPAHYSGLRDSSVT